MNFLISKENIERRIAEIVAEENEVSEREYKYSYMPDKMHMAELFQEKMKLMDVLEVLAGYSLEELQGELDSRDPLQKPDYKGKGLARYSFEVLGHAEKVLQHQDKSLQERVDLGEQVIEQWEKEFKILSWEENKAVYALIRDKDIKLDVLEEKIRATLIRGSEELQELLVDVAGRRCIKVAEWQDGVDSYVLGNAVDSGSFYYAEVNGSICNSFEYDFRPSKEKVEDDWLNLESERAINRYEEEFGADGSRVFPNLNKETLKSENERKLDGKMMEVENMDYQKVLAEFGLYGGDEEFRYQMLSRMKSDCDYYLGNGGRHPKHLWADNEKEQIACMKALWQSFPEDKKPEWLTFEQIQDYEKRMVGIEVLFTFGSWEKFPFQMGYVSITAPSVKMAIEEFRRNYPDVNEGTLNCSDYYYKEEIVAEIKEDGNGAGCHRAIVVSSIDKSVDELIADSRAKAGKAAHDEKEPDFEM